MAMKKFEVKQWYEAKECECGGIFKEQVGNSEYCSYPLQRDYQCNKCGKIKRLREPEWPHLVTEILGDIERG